MAVVVEDGTSKSDADVYISVADCTTYLDKYALEGVLNPFTTTTEEADKEIAVRISTRFVDAWFALKFPGVKYDQAQALQWPRSSATDNDGRTFDTNEMPQVLLNATCELALQVRRDAAKSSPPTPSLAPTQDVPGVLTRKKVKADVVETDKEWDPDAGGAVLQPYYALAEMILAPILESGTRVALG